MKKINKGQQPQDLLQWRAANAATPQNLKYGQGGFPRRAVLSALLRDQGFLCAYTLKRIATDSAHIEHLKPQCVCEAEDSDRSSNGQACIHEDIAWQNLVACFPNPGAPHPEYGALVKNDWWDEERFVSPLAENCEQRFRYRIDGTIEPTVADDEAAKETIRRLNLDSPRLRELRHSAILAVGIHPKAPDPIKSPAKVQRLIQGWQQRYADQSFAEFITVLVHAAQQHLDWIQRQTNRRAYAQGG